MKVVGWGEDRQGTGDPASDNTEFVVEDAATPLVAVEWNPGGEGAAAIWLTPPEDFVGPAYALKVEIQADGGVAELGAVAYEHEAGTVQAITGALTHPDAAIVGPGDRILILGPSGTSAQVELPGRLASSDGLATLQLDPVIHPDAPSRLVVTGAGESWLYSDGDWVRLMFGGDSTVVSLDLLD